VGNREIDELEVENHGFRGFGGEKSRNPRIWRWEIEDSTSWRWEITDSEDLE
jgi:hypothetical protein